MSWANLDDRLHAHPKVRRLQRIPFAGAEAFGIWVWCLSWCRAYAPVTGKVSVENVALDWNADLEHMADVFALLCSVGLVDEEVSGPAEYLIHDWADWQLDQQAKAGMARARTAQRGDNGRFLPSALDKLDTALAEAGDQPATPLHASPHHASPRLDRGLEAARETVRSLSLPRPAPKPVRARP